jgi:hypothetical protein
MAVLEALDRRLQYGPGMRVQRVVEAAFMLAAFFTDDVRFAYVTFALVVLQGISPRLVPVALAVSAVVRPREGHDLSDLYFDLAGTRGACAMSAVVMAAGIALVRAGWHTAGFLVLAFPTTSLVLAPTVGFCAGCAVYVIMRDGLSRLGVVKRCADGACDVDVDREEALGHQR